MANVQLSKKPCYWYNSTSGAIVAGLPEQFPAPSGFQKIICNSAYEADQWSARLRAFDSFKHRIEQDQRELIEGPIRDEQRHHLQHLMANARDNKNREFLRRYLETSEGQGEKWKYKRESYMHCEAFEQGH